MNKKNVTRKDLSEKIYKKIGFSKKFSSEIIDNFFESLISELITSKKIKITSFGTFEVKSKKQRLGRNPKTKIETKISSRKIVKFKPSLIFKKKVNK